MQRIPSLEAISSSASQIISPSHIFEIQNVSSQKPIACPYPEPDESSLRLRPIS